jgi:tetratricopeptide (TPR) repeat protein
LAGSNQSLPIDPYNLRKTGKLKEARDLYSNLLERDRKPFHAFNRALTNLDLGEYEAALEDFRLAAALKEERFLSDSDFLFQGVCFWCLGQPWRAVEMWRFGLNAQYSDASGHIESRALLLYAGERLIDHKLREEALFLLKERVRTGSGRWPEPIAPFLLGDISMTDFVSATTRTKSEVLHQRWQCQADFFIGVRALISLDRALFVEHITRCAVSPQGHLEEEHFLAKWEVSRGFPAVIAA